MKTISDTPFESTYALLMRSDEKRRSGFETLIYALLVASALFAVSQFGRAAAEIPFGVVRASAAPSMTAQARA